MTDAIVIGIALAHPLSIESGELTITGRNA